MNQNIRMMDPLEDCHHFRHRQQQQHHHLPVQIRTQQQQRQRSWSSLFMTSSEPLPPSSLSSLLPSASSQQQPPSLLSSSSSSVDDDDDDDNNNNNNDKTNGIIVLLTVPLAWGTFEVAVRYVYAIQPSLPSLLFSLSYYTIATMALWIINLVVCHSRRTGNINSKNTDSNIQRREQTTNINAVIMYQPNDLQMKHQNTDDATTTTTIMMTSPTLPSPPLLRDPTNESTIIVSNSSSITLVSSPPSPKPPNNMMATTTTSTSNRIRMGGIELGTYLFIGNLFQLLGLLTVSSDRAAFLLQLTTIFVPLVSTLLTAIVAIPSTVVSINNNDDERVHRPTTSISIRMWSACCIALLGVGIMSLDNDALTIDTATTAIVSGSGIVDTILSQFHWSMGDTFIVLAAIAYTFHCIRLEVFAKLCDSAIELASYKAGTEMVWTMITILVLMYASQAVPLWHPSDTLTDQSGIVRFMVNSGRDIEHYWAALSEQQFSFAENVPVLLAILWTGLIPIAYTIVAQTYGQRRVVPVTANLIYTIQPLGTAFFAYVVLHETLGLWGYIGGLIIGFAVLLIVTSTDETLVPLSASTSNDD